MDRFVQKGCACRVVLARLKHQANYTTNSVESGVTYSFFANCTAESTSTLSLHRSPPVAPAMAPYVRGRRGVVVFRSTGNKCNFKTVCRDQSITRQSNHVLFIAAAQKLLGIQHLPPALLKDVRTRACSYPWHAGDHLTLALALVFALTVQYQERITFSLPMMIYSHYYPVTEREGLQVRTYLVRDVDVSHLCQPGVREWLRPRAGDSIDALWHTPSGASSSASTSAGSLSNPPINSMSICTLTYGPPKLLAGGRSLSSSFTAAGAFPPPA